MAFSRDTYIADGVTKQYAIVFDDGYLNKDDISVYLMPIEQGGANEPINYIFINDYLIELEYAPASGREIVIEREADASKRLVEFTPSFIRAADLNVMYKHLLYLSQGIYDGRFSEAFGANIDMNNYRIINVGTPVEDNDAARWVDVKDVLPARDETLVARDEAVNAAARAKVSEDVSAQAQAVTTANRDEVATYRVEVEEIATEVEDNRQQAQAAANTSSADADATAADRVAVENATGLAQGYEQSARISAQNASNDATTAEVKAMEAEEAALRAEQAASQAESLTVFSINEASKDVSGNPNFMSVSGNQITFNGAVKYTQANGESKEYASVSPIALASGYVMLNNGIASVVPALEVQQSEPDGIVNQPTFTSNTTDGFTIISNLIKEDLYRLYNGVSSTYVIGPWSECVLGIEYISDLRLMSYTLQADTKGSVEHPIEWVVEGSIDGSNWFQIDYRNDEDFASGEEKTYYVNISEKYSKHRVRFVRGVEAGGNGELKKIGFEFLTPANQTVWFNSYNNQAKQYNGTDWVDYNGVPVGTIIDGVAYTYQYNTQKNVEPWINTATKDSLNELNRFRLIDSYRQDVFWYKIFEETQNDGSVKYWCRQGGLTYVASNKNITQTLLIPFTEREPTLLGQSTEARIDSQSINMYFNPYWLSIQIYNSGTNQSIYWYTEGYCAKPEEIL